MNRWIAVGAIAIGSERSSLAQPPAEVPTVSIRAGAVAALDPGRGSPACELGGSIPLAMKHLRLDAILGLWTIDGSAPAKSETEVAFAASPTWFATLAGDVSWSVGVGPALRYTEGPGTPYALRPGVVLSPGLALQTRRTGLALDVGLRAMLFSDGTRWSAVGGATYRFH